MNIEALQSFVDHATKDPSILHKPELRFFRDFVTNQLNGQIPPIFRDSDHPCEDDPDIWHDNDIEHYARVMPIENDPTEEQLEIASEKKKEAAMADSPEKAVALMTEALKVKSDSAMYWAARAQYYLEAKKANCAIQDANRALEINPDSAKALRARGVAYRHLGRWEEAAEDLAAADKIDYDEKTIDITKYVTERANAIRVARRRAEAAKSDEHHKMKRPAPTPEAASSHQDPFGSLPPGLREVFNDPDIQEDLKKPGVMEKISAAMSNPALAMGLMSDPVCGPLFAKIMSKMGGPMGGMGGGMSHGSNPVQPEVDEDLD